VKMNEERDLLNVDMLVSVLEVLLRCLPNKSCTPTHSVGSNESVYER
jgi:hypothetical protein